MYLEDRNIVLLSKTTVYCAHLGIERIALGLLADNPFPDATPEFFAAAARTLSLGLGRTIAIATPLTGWRKDEVIRRGLDLGVPLEATLSCMNPTGEDGHCGACSKCRERRDAYRVAGIPDPTIYAVQWKRSV